jgi:hypothetical protein
MAQNEKKKKIFQKVRDLALAITLAAGITAGTEVYKKFIEHPPTQEETVNIIKDQVDAFLKRGEMIQ